MLTLHKPLTNVKIDLRGFGYKIGFQKVFQALLEIDFKYIYSVKSDWEIH